MSRQRHITRWVVVVVLVAVVICGWVFVPGALMRQPRPPTIAVAEAQPATVIRVIDDDTLIVTPEDRNPVTVRILGVDTPKTVHPDKPVQGYGPEAFADLPDLLPHRMISGQHRR
ncbi:thermonuclease family protein [Plantibacter sp. RU18]|uniref:thermonuclease family protein n=1 Tax=Plantibacter sp. RU18 TaxID=3158143 RepID=UPI003D35F3BA